MTFDPFNPATRAKSSAASLSLNEMDMPASSKRTEPSFAPSSQRELTGHDISLLKPRTVTNVAMGLEFYVPGHWKETKNASSIHMQDPLTGTKLQAHGLTRPGLKIEQWAAMRLPVITKEMPYMVQVAHPSTIKGQDWGHHIQGVVAEYRGRAAGETEDTCIIICCLRTEDILISVMIMASATEFEKNRAIYQWIFSRIDIGEPGRVPNSGKLATSSKMGQQQDHGDEGDIYLGYVASGQRLVLMSILLMFGLGAWVKTLDYTDRTQLIITLFMYLMVVVMSCFGLWRMARGLRWSIPGRIFLFILTMVPLVGLLTLFFTNRKASARLREEGYKVGFLGAPAAIPASNHDFRNVFVVCAMLTGSVYLVATWLVPAPKELPMAEFSPPGSHFSISMPGTPNELRAPQIQGVSNNHAYALRAGKFSYGVSYFDMPMIPRDKAGTLDLLRESVVSLADGTVLGEEKTDINGNEGRTVKMKMKGAYREIHYFIVDKTIYILEAGTPKGQENSPKIAEFLYSFHLK